MKYRQRYNWTHRDLLRKAHPKAGSSEVNDLFAWITQGTAPPVNPYFTLIHAYEQAKTADPEVLATHQGTRPDLGDGALRTAGQTGSMGSPG